MIGLCVGNDDDVRGLVTGSLGDIPSGAVIVDHTTTSTKIAREMSALVYSSAAWLSWMLPFPAARRGRRRGR